MSELSREDRLWYAWLARNPEDAPARWDDGYREAMENTMAYQWYVAGENAKDALAGLRKAWRGLVDRVVGWLS